MRKYEVVAACYVPVGPGMKWKKPGQVVTLDDVDASGLGGRVTPVEGFSSTPSRRKGVQKLNTETKRASRKKAEKPVEEVEVEPAEVEEPVEVDWTVKKPFEADPVEEVDFDGEQH